MTEAAPVALTPPPLDGGTAVERTRLMHATAAAFTAASAARHRHPHQFGISGVGGCRRAAAYALAKIPASDDPGPGEGRAANLGTWEHDGLLPRLAEQLPGSTTEPEVRVRVAGLELIGHIDLDDPATVVDLKTVGEWRLQGVRAGRAGTHPDSKPLPVPTGRRVPAAYYHHRMQVGTYGLGRLQEGRPPRYVAWLYLDRANGDQEIIVEEFTNGLALEVIDRLTELAVYAAEDPAAAPADEPGPGLSIVCDQCPWLRSCWGPDAVPGRTGPQAVKTDPQIEAALLDYVEARSVESAAALAKKVALAKVGQARHRVYGTVKYGRNQDSNIVDEAAAVAKLRRLGLEVPRTTRRGAVQVKLVGEAKPGTDTP